MMPASVRTKKVSPERLKAAKKAIQKATHQVHKLETLCRNRTVRAEAIAQMKAERESV